MKPISPWFQTAALMSAIRNAICDLEAARPDRSSNSQPIGNGSLRRRAEAGKTTARFDGYIPRGVCAKTGQHPS
jgi:hypothetical protein